MKKPADHGTRPGLRSRIITIVAGGAAVAYALLVFVPGQESVAELRRQVQQKERQISQNDLLAQPIRQLEDQLAATQTFTANWRSIAPRPNSMSTVLAEVIRHARQSGAEVTTITPQAEQALETIGSVPVSIEVEGSYHSIHDLLYRLEEMPQALWIEELQLQRGKSDADRLECQLKLIIFADRSEISG